MLGRMARRVQDFDRDVTDFKNFAIAGSTKWKYHFSAFEEHVFGTGCFREFSARRNVVGM
jgi:hypothetical protein